MSDMFDLFVAVVCKIIDTFLNRPYFSVYIGENFNKPTDRYISTWDTVHSEIRAYICVETNGRLPTWMLGVIRRSQALIGQVLEWVHMTSISHIVLTYPSSVTTLTTLILYTFIWPSWDGGGVGLTYPGRSGRTVDMES